MEVRFANLTNTMMLALTDIINLFWVTVTRSKLRTAQAQDRHTSGRQGHDMSFPFSNPSPPGMLAS